jgi:hypothetical protein
MDITFTLHFDETSKNDNQYLDWYNKNKNNEDYEANIKLCMLIGSYILRNGLNGFVENEKENMEIKSLNEILTQTIENNNKRIENIKHSKDSYYNDQIEILNDKIKKLKSDIIEISTKERESVKKEFEPTIEYLKGQLEKFSNENKEQTRLQDIIKDKEQQLAILKGNNIVKGNIGENLIKSIISKCLTTHEILDMSGASSMSDLHLVNHKEERIVVECKNKVNITLGDVEKSIRDIETLLDTYGNKFMGYLFISIRSCNIPRKGDFHIEYIKDRPIIWYGFDIDINANYEHEFINVLKIIVGLTNIFKGNTSIDKDDLLAKINSYLGRIKDQKKIITSLSTNVGLIKVQVEKINEITTYIYDDMLEYVKLYGIDQILIGESFEKKEINEFQCNECEKSFKTNGGLVRHLCKKKEK